MSAAINVVCYKWKTLANGESPLMVRVAKGGKRTMQSLGISINPKYWDFTRNKPKPNCPNKEYIQKIILDKQRELQQRMLELNVEQKEYTTTTLLNNENTKFELKTVSEFYHELIEQYTREDKCGNRLIYKSSFNSLKAFTKGKLDIPFSDIDTSWLNKYEKWLRSKDNKETTISLMFRTLRSTYNKAIKAKCARKSDYPFDDYKINKFDTTTQKRAIAKTDVLKFTTRSTAYRKAAIHRVEQRHIRVQLSMWWNQLHRYSQSNKREYSKWQVTLYSSKDKKANQNRNTARSHADNRKVFKRK